MRSKEEILKDGLKPDYVMVELLLDIRELLTKEEVAVPLYVSDKPPKPRKKRKITK